MDRKTPRNTKRNIICFEPTGHLASMLACELRGKPRGHRTNLIELALVNHLRAKYPKMAANHDAVKAEK